MRARLAHSTLLLDAQVVEVDSLPMADKQNASQNLRLARVPANRVDPAEPPELPALPALRCRGQ